MLHDSTESMSDDGAIGYGILSTKKNNKRFEMSFLLAEENIPDCKNSLLVNVLYDGFEPRKLTENIRLKFDLLSKDDKASQIEIKVNVLSAQQLKELNDFTKGMKVSNSRDFTIKKDDYKNLLNSKSVKYFIQTETHSVSGEFPEESILDLEKYSKKLLTPICFKGQTIEESEKELKEGFVDFEVLKAGASKIDIEKHFHTKFRNNVKNPDTGAYEETIIVKLFKQDSGTLIIGFDENNKLIYVRDALDKTKISYLKPR